MLTALSTNITSMFLDSPRLAGLAGDVVVDGFDTFTGLPEAWSNGKGGYYYKKGKGGKGGKGKQVGAPETPGVEGKQADAPAAPGVEA